MPTLVPGACKPQQAGFTLLELLVVVVVLSIAAGLIVVRGTPGDANYLQADAQKVVQLLRIAQQESVLKSKEIRFVAGSEGFQFEEFTGSRWVPVQTEPMLRPRRWDHGPLEVQLLREGRANAFLGLESTVGLTQKTIVLRKNKTQLVMESRNGSNFIAGKPTVVLDQGGRS